jgi:hypothetical protein
VKIFSVPPLEDPRDARTLFPRLEAIGDDGAFRFEAKHDPFLPLVAAAEHTRALRLGTAVAIAFARNPMNLANLANLAWGAALHGELDRRLNQGRWHDMTSLITGLTHNRAADPEHWADVVAEMKRP